MKWIVHLTVVLVNILWVAFFLTDPLAVFVQKRSSIDYDEEMKVGEFCLQPPSDPMWTSAPGPANIYTDKTRMTSDVYAAPTTAAGEAPSTSSAVRDLNEATTATPTVQTSTSSEVTSVPEQISSSTSEAVPDPAIVYSTVLVIQRNKQDADVPLKVIPFQDSVPRRKEWHRWWSGSSHSIRPDICCFSYYQRRIKKDFIASYEMTDNRCTKLAVILITKQSRRMCADPGLSWVRGIMKYVDDKSF